MFKISEFQLQQPQKKHGEKNKQLVWAKNFGLLQWE